MLYLYAIATSNRVPAIPGRRGASLGAVGEDGLFAFVSEHGELHLEPREDDLWAHEHVVEELMSDEPLLPMRFGSGLPDAAAVIRTLNERREELGRALDG